MRTGWVLRSFTIEVREGGLKRLSAGGVGCDIAECCPNSCNVIGNDVFGSTVGCPERRPESS